MLYFKFFFVFVCLVSGIGGCAFSRDVSVETEELASQIRMGVATKENIHSLLGTPSSTFLTTINGQPTEVWNYHQVIATINPLLSIPVVGPLFISSKDAVKSEDRAFTFYFSERGIVRGIYRETVQYVESKISIPSEIETKRMASGVNTPTNFGGSLLQEAFNKIEIFHSSKDDVLELLGKPTTSSTNKTTEGFQELWTYFYTKINTTAGESQGTSHRVIFNEQDVVSEIATAYHSWLIAPSDLYERKEKLWIEFP